MTLIDRLFRKSPFGPIIEHAKIVCECVEFINPLIKAWLREDWDEIDRLGNEISRKEHEADKMKISIRNNLPKSLFYPVPRGDLLRILHNQDNIADTVEDLAVVLTLRRTQLPKDLVDDFQEFVNQVLETYKMLISANEKLDLLLEASFTGPPTEKVLKTLDEIGTLEWKCDKKARELVKKLIAKENQLEPLTIIFIMKILQEIGSIANYAENCGDNLRHLIISRT